MDRYLKRKLRFYFILIRHVGCRIQETYRLSERKNKESSFIINFYLASGCNSCMKKCSTGILCQNDVERLKGWWTLKTYKLLTLGHKILFTWDFKYKLITFS